MRRRTIAVSRLQWSELPWLTIVLVLGLFLSWVASTVLIHTASEQSDVQGRIHIVTNKSLIFYASHAASILCALLSGCIAIAEGGWRRMTTVGNIAIAVMAYAAVVWALIGYAPDDLFSSRIFSETGPFVWLILIAGFAGTDDRVWPAIDKTVCIIGWLSAAVATYSLLRNGSFRHYYTFSPFLLYCKDLAVFGGWTMLRGVGLKGWRRLAHCIPWGLLVITAIYAQGRSWLINAGLLLFFYVCLPGRRDEPRLTRTLPMIAGSIAAFLLVVLTPLQARFLTALNAFQARLYVDSRSGQIADFLDDMKLWDFVVGRGPQGTWYWHGVGNYQFLDNAYLWMLFVGGLPIFIGYLLYIVLPALRVAFGRFSGLDAVAAYVVVLWSIQLTGLSTFTHPSLDEPSFLIALLAGRCHHALVRTPAWSKYSAFTERAIWSRWNRARLALRPQ